MLNLMRILLLLFSIAWQHLHPVYTQYVPPVACPNYFEYLSYGGQYIGRITIPNIPFGETKVEVQFTQREPVSNYYGRLSLYDDQEVAVARIQAGQPVSYRVDFPLPGVLPKLTRIAVNGNNLCVASDYPPPSTTLRLDHTLRTYSTTIQQPNTLNPFISDYNNPNAVIPIRNNGFVTNNPFFTDRTSAQRPQSVSPPTFAGSNLRPASPQTFSNSQPTFNTIPASTPNIITDFRQQQPQQRPVVTTTQTTVTINAVCGQEGTTVAPFVYGGSILNRGQFPWLTAIYKKQSDGLTFLCGGSLVSSRTIITAAHCFKLTNLAAHQVLVYLGRYNLTDYNENGFVTREVQSLALHPEYNTDAFPDADIAIIQLQTAVNFNQYIRPVCLWSGDITTSRIVGETAVVSGWGADETGRSVSDVPKQVGISIVSEAECQKMEIFKKWATQRTLCAGNRDGNGPCIGDSGGGLMLSRNGRWVLRGVVSAGEKKQNRCNLDEYVIYCDLAKHMSWVQSNMLV